MLVDDKKKYKEGLRNLFTGEKKLRMKKLLILQS